VGAISRGITRIMDKWTQDLAQIQLLGVHAAIRRYLWECDRLPGSLEDLRLGALVTDLFTGKPLLYRAVGERAYELSGHRDAGHIPSYRRYGR